MNIKKRNLEFQTPYTAASLLVAVSVFVDTETWKINGGWNKKIWQHLYCWTTRQLSGGTFHCINEGCVHLGQAYFSMFCCLKKKLTGAIASQWKFPRHGTTLCPPLPSCSFLILLSVEVSAFSNSHNSNNGHVLPFWVQENKDTKTPSLKRTSGSFCLQCRAWKPNTLQALPTWLRLQKGSLISLLSECKESKILALQAGF